jgi:dynein heavy chain
LERAVRAEGSVETWLTSLLQTSQQSLHAIIRQAFIMINDMNFSLLPFLDKMPAQVNLYKEVNAFSQQASVMYYLY